MKLGIQMNYRYVIFYYPPFFRSPQNDVEDVLVNYCLYVGNYVINQNKIEKPPTRERKP